MSMWQVVSRGATALALATVVCLGGRAKADMTLTPTAITDGFLLSTFATDFPTLNGVGPLGIGFTSSGGVLVSDYPGNVRLFPTDTDGQSAGSVPVAQNYGGGQAVGISQVGNTFYMTQQASGDLIQINPNGTFNQFIVGGLPAATGITTNPLNNHIYVSTLGNNFIADVDPIAKTFTTLVNTAADGLSTDGKVLYGAIGGHILGFDIVTKAQVFDSGFINGLDGTALGNGKLAGKIFGNTNFGELWEVDLATSAQTLIGSGGSRGDFVTVDPNGTLLLTQTDRILRLTAPKGGGFGSVPEPGALTMLLTSGVGFSLLMRRQRK